MDKTISSIMQKMVQPVSMDDTVVKVKAVLTSHGFSSVPVVDRDGAVLGIITTRDLARFDLPGKDPNNVRAWEICSYKPIMVRPDAPLREVAELMVQGKIHHVLVEEGGVMKGIVSSLDFVKLFLSQEPS